ncbi:serine/threonine-protein kinase [Streptomyces sp. NPDC051582]|uniref:serine/threonine-protein kinase n=1 Tax=Streptomyces sp. NPDC051582 TaxID=3155167 RepID=UPI00343EC966
MAGNDVFPAGLVHRYRPLDVLGRGGMGVVFEAEDTQLQRRVAVKLLSAFSTSLTQEMEQRFLREAIALARISHPGVVGIHDYGVDDASGAPYLVMEVLDGVDLPVLAAGRPLSAAAAVWIAVEMLGALEAAHRSGVLHRDVKPGNVRVSRDGHVVLYDFGLAVVAEEPRITETGVRLMGTVQYMAPERIGGLAPSAATDLYGVGACLHYMLTGSPPFGGRAVDLGVLVLRAAEGLPPLRERGLSLPDGLAEAVDVLCAADYRNRPAGAAAAAALLSPWAAGGKEQVVRLITRRLDAPPLAGHATGHAPPAPEQPEYDWRQVDVTDAVPHVPNAITGGAFPSPALPRARREAVLSEVTRNLVRSRMTERTALSRQREAVVLVQRGEFRQAARLLADVLAFCHESLGADHPTTLACQFWQAVCQARLGEAALALELFARVSAHHAQERDGSDD